LARRGREPAAQEREQVEHVDARCPIKLRGAVAGEPEIEARQQTKDADLRGVTIGLARARRRQRPGEGPDVKGIRVAEHRCDGVAAGAVSRRDVDAWAHHPPRSASSPGYSAAGSRRSVMPTTGAARTLPS